MIFMRTREIVCKYYYILLYFLLFLMHVVIVIITIRINIYNEDLKKLFCSDYFKSKQTNTRIPKCQNFKIKKIENRWIF